MRCSTAGTRSSSSTISSPDVARTSPTSPHLPGCASSRQISRRHRISRRLVGPVDRVYHLASPASPVDYARHPLETLMTNAVGTRNALDIARRWRAQIPLHVDLRDLRRSGAAPAAGDLPRQCQLAWSPLLLRRGQAICRESRHDVLALATASMSASRDCSTPTDRARGATTVAWSRRSACRRCPGSR